MGAHTGARQMIAAAATGQGPGDKDVKRTGERVENLAGRFNPQLPRQLTPGPEVVQLSLTVK